MSVRIGTPWQSELLMTTRPLTDGEKHDLFAMHVQQVINHKMPWLLVLLEASGAAILASPGRFQFGLHSAPNAWYEIPEIANLITTVPWVEEDKSHQ